MSDICWMSWEGTAVARVPRTRIANVNVDGVNVFYREAGDATAPVVLLLHGVPSSSFMFRDLMPRLADRFHVIAPDYPGFGFTQIMDRSDYAYTFDGLADTIRRFTEILELHSFAIYVQDYGGAVGLRIALKHPDRISAIVAQNIGLYVEAMTDPVWDDMKTTWADPTPERLRAFRDYFDYDNTKFEWLLGVRDPDAVAPETYTLDYALLQRPGVVDIQVDLLLDFKTELDHYPKYQRYLRDHQPPVLAVFGDGDTYFPPLTVELLRRDLPQAEIYLYPSGHFALETHVDEIAERIQEFLARTFSVRGVGAN